MSSGGGALRRAVVVGRVVAISAEAGRAEPGRSERQQAPASYILPHVFSLSWLRARRAGVQSRLEYQQAAHPNREVNQTRQLFRHSFPAPDPHYRRKYARIHPPFGSGETFHATLSKITIDEIVANGAVLEFALRKPDKQPLRFEIHEALLRDVGWKGAL